MNRSRNTKQILVFLLMVASVVMVAARTVSADFTFGNLTNLGPVINTPMQDLPAFLSSDGLSLWFSRSSSSWVGGYFVATRPTVDDPWGTPVSVGPWTEDLSSFKTMGVVPGWTTADGLETINAFAGPGGYGSSDIYLLRRDKIGADWGQPTNLGPVVNSTASESANTYSLDALELYFSDDNGPRRPGGYGSADLWVTKRATRNDPWGTPVNLGPTANSANEDGFPLLLADGLVLSFLSRRPGGYGEADLYMMRRASLSDSWGPPMNLGPLVNSSGEEWLVYMSADGSTLFFNSDRPGGYGGHDIWQVSILPIVDFNGDGEVDGKEVLAMAEHWGQSYPPCDIGPTPMGDALVDAKDLTVLAGYIGQDVNDPTLVAHWALDEVGGSVAIDWVGEHDAMIIGNVVWQPDGRVGGTLAFDGKTNFARTMSPVLDPAQGPFSVIAWVKGGAAGRVIVSQASGTDWLCLNQYGMLTTDLKAAGRDGKSLTSDAFILDDQWHRVVLVWDGTNRALHMDGVEVARDTQPSLAASSGSLHIGGGKSLNPVTFWSGLIDDVRIYNRAVQP